MKRKGLSTATPFEVDSQLAELDGEYARLSGTEAAALERVHDLLGERARYVRRGRKEWPTSHAEAVTLLRDRLTAGTLVAYDVGRATKTLDKIKSLRAEMSENRAAADVLDAEYQRRRWTRFFLVVSSDGHIHANQSCSSYPSTKHGWQPELSGKSEAEAVEKLGPRMCTKCFPSAPTEWTVGKAKPPKCDGTGQYVGYAKARRVGMRHYAQCPVCLTTQILIGGGNLRAHPPAKTTTPNDSEGN